MQLTDSEIEKALPWLEMIEALNDIFRRDDVISPIRHHHNIGVPDEADATLLLMPAWIRGEYLGVKQVNVFPGNSTRSMPGLSSNYLLSSGQTGQPIALLDGNELTARRTAAASALASRYLSREDSSELLMVGAGRMGRRLIPAHMSVRPITCIRVWDRYIDNAQQLVEDLRTQGLDAYVCQPDDLKEAVSTADIVSCATLATDPVVLGDWLQPGTHVDLVGGFTPLMREVDNDAIQKSQVFVDTRLGALKECGDLIIPIEQGVFQAESIHAEFSELCKGLHAGRQTLKNANQAITLFKSVGDSREDLAAAILACKNAGHIKQ